MDMEDISGKRTAFGMRERRAAKDRLQPALLDRLTDNEPLKKKESRDSVMITYDTLRHAVLRDLRWVLNTVNIETVDDLDAFAQVRSSTVNFGVEALAGRRMSEIDWVDMEQSIKTAIIHFEPRILADSLEVACVSEVTSLEHHNVLSLEIRGKLWCNPYPREFLFRTDIDLESGHMDLQEQGAGLMEQRFLDYYNRELAYIREMGKEFADHYPKIAGRLGMNGIEVADPYVERLLEGFSFLTARIHMKMDAEFPQFSQRLLEVVYPNYLAPTPSMAVVQVSPSMNEGSLAKGFVLPKGTVMRGRIPKTEQTPCEFVTGHALTLWPLQVTAAELSGVPPDLPLKRMNLNNRNQPVRSSLRIRLEIKGGVKLHEFKLDQLVFHLNGQDIHMQRLLELIMGHTITVLCHDAEKPVKWINRINVNDVRHEGFESDQALLPAEARIFQGYRIIQEYFAFPTRFMFFSVNNMQKALKLPTAIATGSANAAGGQESRSFELTFLFDKDIPELQGNVTAENLALHCTPVVNLFQKKADRITISPTTHEYHLVVDRTRPLDFEVYSTARVAGYSNVSDLTEKEFRPFFGSLGSDTDDYGAYYSMRREPRLLSDTAARNGARTGYIGSEVFISLVDKHQAPFSEDLRHLSMDVLCTNRDLPMLMPIGQKNDLALRVSAPIEGIKILRGPSRPRPALAQGAYAWHLISHLGLNYLSLIDLDTEKGAQTLREMLKIYANIADPAIAKQINGVRHVRVEAVHHRLPVPGPIVFGRGARIHLEVDEGAFSGVSPYLFGAVLEQFFARHVSINMMSELVLSTMQHGELARWKPRMGTRPAV